ncbi:MAG: FKBP-type peptidyl-prolyl cis-trans isomerase [Bacteroidaceae bacterium]|nr:FKBP-type peptidyl-prolyl cis-trans isomerase [Bacteroidaceae bacterium]
MKTLKTLFVLLLAVGLTLPAASRKKTKLPVQAAPVAGDVMDINTFSYYLGRANTNGLREYLVQRLGVDTTYLDDFLKGFETAKFSKKDLREKARLAGIEIRKQVEEQVLPSANKQVNDSVDMLDKELFIEGFRKGISREEWPISMDSTQVLVKEQLDHYTRVNNERKFAANKRAGEAFLTANSMKDSVVVTASGLQYKVLRKGTGPVPQLTDKVSVHYEGRLVDGTVFDSSYKRNRPATFGVNQVIQGWIQALTMMPVGSKWEIYVPQELAYAEKDQGKIPPFSCLIFTVELLEIANPSEGTKN